MPGPDYFGDGAKRQRRRKRPDWQKHEADVAARRGGRVTRGSGNVRPTLGGRRNAARGITHTTADPGDVVDHRLRECKSSRQPHLTVQIDWLPKVVDHALARTRRAVLELRLELAVLPTPTDWVLVPSQDYEDLEEQARARGFSRAPARERDREETAAKSRRITIKCLDVLVERAPTGSAPELEIHFSRLAERPGVPADWILTTAEGYDSLEEQAGEAGAG